MPFWRIAECIEIVSLNFQIEGLKIKKDNKRVEQISLCGEFDQSILIIYRLFIDLRIDYCDLFKDQIVVRVLHVWSIFKQKEGNCGLNVLIFTFFYRN